MVVQHFVLCTVLNKNHFRHDLIVVPLTDKYGHTTCMQPYKGLLLSDFYNDYCLASLKKKKWIVCGQFVTPGRVTQPIEMTKGFHCFDYASPWVWT